MEGIVETLREGSEGGGFNFLGNINYFY
jgi:hypothetical protein